MRTTRRIMLGLAVVALIGVTAATTEHMNQPSRPAGSTAVPNSLSSTPAAVVQAASQVHTAADFAKASPAVRKYLQTPAWQSHTVTKSYQGTTPKVSAP